MSSPDTQLRYKLVNRLTQAQADLSLDLSDSQKIALIDYLFELNKWNRTYNLTAVRNVDDMLVQHVFDCLAIIPVFKRYELQEGLNLNLVADVGSGAGLPAVVLAIVRPDVTVISIDTVQKKTSFVQNVASKLALVNLRTYHGRVETISDIKADVVVSRAFASLKAFIDLSSGLLSKNGVMVAMKSKQLDSEIRELNRDQNSWYVQQVDEIQVPEMPAKRYVAWLRRKNNE